MNEKTNHLGASVVMNKKVWYRQEGEMKETILLVDVDPERADNICDLLVSHEIPAKRCNNIEETKITIDSESRPAVIVAHCALVHHSFTELARLRTHPNVKLLFYCTDKEEKADPILKLPEELKEIILRITESSRKFASA